MNKKHVLGFLCLILSATYYSYAQQPIELTCEQKALTMLEREPYLSSYSKEFIEELLVYIEPCATEGDPASQYIAALLYWESEREQNMHKGFNLLQSASRGYDPALLKLAMTYLRELENYPFHKISYPKASNALRSMISPRNYKTDIANYVLGYLNMKHFPNALTPDYSKAKSYFESSNHPMAKHWLAIMYYFGYGVTQDKAKARQMLAENDIYNSEVLLTYLDTQNSDWLPMSAEELSILNEYGDNFNQTSQSFNGIYDGRFIEFDWSRDLGVKRDVPFTIDFDWNESSRDLTYELSIAEQTFSGQTKLSNGFISFNDSPLSFKLPRLYKDHKDKDSLEYNISQIFLRENILIGESIFIGQLQGSIADLNEPMPHSKMIFKKRTGTTALQNSTIANSELKNKLDQDFAIIHPNPIQDQFKITFNTNQFNNMTVSVYNFFGQKLIEQSKVDHRDNTQKTVTLNSSDLPSGTYIVQIKMDNKTYSKIVTKE
ncbi:T9SS type A sorting domain-containing protein [Aquimarina algicola]|uniref:T9SS type A sorting domain-containing protein n=1 Tax=Aquimarina algicola TaxID=2589995 RepID=A0A504JH44_9FLAO|nr:T9SS type A sorting domain-containing protein [Aquimarina algicola]TPN85780.1 T9SS type A sorting domain-containing protein [Aquimarina algicola]